jgi:hypothetical protein
MSNSHSESSLVHAITAAAFKPAGVVGAAVHGTSDHPGALLTKKSVYEQQCAYMNVCKSASVSERCNSKLAIEMHSL